MKKILILLIALLSCYSSFAMSGDSLYVYSNGSVIRSFLRSTVDSINYSKTDIDGVTHDYYSTQIIYSQGQQHKDALEVVDSVIYFGKDKSNISIYAVGVELNDNGYNVVKVWKNGTVIKELTDGTNNAWCQNIAFVGNDYYVVGYDGENLNATVWKNGNASLLPDVGNYSNATDIIADGEDYYICGYAYDSNYLCNAHIWKNGKSLLDFNNNGGDVQVYNLAKMNGSILTAAGTLGNDNYAEIFKDKSMLYQLTPSNGSKGQAHSVCVYNGDVYSCGYEFVNNGDYSTAKVWKNGELLKDLSDGNSNAKALSMAFDDEGHYYVCGLITVNGKKQAVIWKDGEILYKLSPSSISVANRLVVYKGDVYTVGYYTLENPTCEIACVWKNGDVMYNLTDKNTKQKLYNVASGLTIKVEK